MHRIDVGRDVGQFRNLGIIVESAFRADSDSGKQIFFVFLLELVDFLREYGIDNLGNDAAYFFPYRRAIVAHVRRLRWSPRGGEVSSRVWSSLPVMPFHVLSIARVISSLCRVVPVPQIGPLVPYDVVVNVKMNRDIRLFRELEHRLYRPGDV